MVFAVLIDLFSTCCAAHMLFLSMRFAPAMQWLVSTQGEQVVLAKTQDGATPVHFAAGKKETNSTCTKTRQLLGRELGVAPH